MNRVAVLSAGSWGTTFAAVLADAGNEVVLHGRRREVVDAINARHENPVYLPGVALPQSLRATTDVAEALAGADHLVVSIPAQSLRANLTAWAPLIEPRTLVVSLMKGIETHTGLRMSEVITEVTGIPAERVAVVSGPNLAREIAARQPAASVIACRDETAAKALQNACVTPYFRPYTNTDVVGCELGGAVKNVIALAIGLAAGMGLGNNARALLMTRGLAETARLGAVMGADPLTFSGLAGVGDLIATCSSPLSRNRAFGEHLGQGMTVAEATTATSQTAEGVKSSQSILELARRHGVEMPITEVVVAVINGTATVDEAASMLMNRSPKPERYGV
ncbi:NAD(P)-dependent glycerol-3-phosphate dehydrogenase [Streptomyces sp. A3M-1-3]|uniref:NAD(P)H-dependent glycerol-3-phosphate dehydrogenase n=1 Tax=Streptomyces sp. A3M-1-3 TaxID=2962044 RepID=UPI0020B7C040|nr:NAD(P)H-dependent glycerol-3-phosphate dehydrogenase [Streptomyces sp. A3M-1-3]MCP3822100.1 NAD(P)-dependent glycerol-3-phosphate dehydrogenase [Streptomyces sp. A3M-1-3]